MYYKLASHVDSHRNAPCLLVSVITSWHRLVCCFPKRLVPFSLVSGPSAEVTFALASSTLTVSSCTFFWVFFFFFSAFLWRRKWHARPPCGACQSAGEVMPPGARPQPGGRQLENKSQLPLPAGIPALRSRLLPQRASLGWAQWPTVLTGTHLTVNFLPFLCTLLGSAP